MKTIVFVCDQAGMKTVLAHLKKQCDTTTLSSIPAITAKQVVQYDSLDNKHIAASLQSNSKMLRETKTETFLQTTKTTISAMKKSNDITLLIFYTDIKQATALQLQKAA